MLCQLPRKEWQVKCIQALWWHTKGWFTLEVLDLRSHCKPPTPLRVVRAGFATHYRLHEGDRFVLVPTNG